MAHQGNSHEQLHTPAAASRLARTSLDFLRQCEQAELLTCREMTDGSRGYSAADIHTLARVRRLHDDLGLDLDAIAVVLHLRAQVMSLQMYLDEVEQHTMRREQELLNEVQRLRHRLAEDVVWRADD